MRKLTICLLVLALAAPAFATHLIDSVRITVSSGSHTISTASFPNGVWFDLMGGVRETVKIVPPFPTVSPGGVVTVTRNLVSDPDTVIGANFDISMDAVPHPGGNHFTGAAWTSRINAFGDLVGHAPNDADIRYQLVLKADPPPAAASGLSVYGFVALGALLAGAGIYYFRRRKALAV